MKRWILLVTLTLLVAGVISHTDVRAQPMKFVSPGEKIPTQGNLHIEKATDPHVPYNTTPPTSGPHLHRVAPWGIHKEPILNELQVHNLEDGGVLIQYNCKDCDKVIAQLEKFTAEYNKVIVAPYPDMKTPIALTAWGRIATLEKPDDARIERFIRAYMGMDHHVRR